MYTWNKRNEDLTLLEQPMWTQTITLTGGTVDNAPQKTRDQARENTPQRLLAGYSLAEPSLAKPSLAKLSLAELSLT